jgi:hypothetical protein
MQRASDINRESACSPVVVAPASGVFITTMPRAVAAATSMLSTPMPARPTTARLPASSSDLPVTCVAERTTSAW